MDTGKTILITTVPLPKPKPEIVPEQKEKPILVDWPKPEKVKVSK